MSRRKGHNGGGSTASRKRKTPECRCRDATQSGRQVVEGYEKLTELSRVLGKELDSDGGLGDETLER